MSAFQTEIYAGSSSFYPGDTPFGFYDFDAEFQQDVDKVTEWCALKLGFPNMDVELHTSQFYAAFEEAITEYGAQINSIATKDNLLNILGIPTSSAALNGTLVGNSLSSVFQLAKDYGSEANTGIGKLTYYTGSIPLREGVQKYDMLTDGNFETGTPTNERFTIRRIFYQAVPSSVRYFDPYLGTGLGTQQMLDSFGWGSFSPPLSFLLMPVHYDMMRMQAIELNDVVRKSGYTFELTNTRLRIFPIPRNDYDLIFQYTLDDEHVGASGSGITGVVTDHSNVPYMNPIYKYINALGRQWIKRYTLALCKEMLGWIRGKYSTIPIPDQDTTLNGNELLTAGQEEKQSLIEELRDLLDQYTKQAQLERKQAEAEALNKQLSFVPLKIYIR